jgi:hypothetical protein
MTYKYCSHEGCNLPLKLPKSVDVMFGWFCAAQHENLVTEDDKTSSLMWLEDKVGKLEALVSKLDIDVRYLMETEDKYVIY